MTVNTNVVVAVFVGPAFAIVPETAAVYTPATVGTVQAMTLVDGVNVINDVLWPAFAVITAV